MSISLLTNSPYLDIVVHSVTAEEHITQNLEVKGTLIVDTACQINGPSIIKDDLVVTGSLQVGTTNGGGTKYILPNESGTDGQYLALSNDNQTLVWTTGSGGSTSLQQGNNMDIHQVSSNVYYVGLQDTLTNLTEVDTTTLKVNGSTLVAPSTQNNGLVIGCQNGQYAWVSDASGGITLQQGTNMNITQLPDTEIYNIATVTEPEFTSLSTGTLILNNATFPNPYDTDNGKVLGVDVLGTYQLVTPTQYVENVTQGTSGNISVNNTDKYNPVIDMSSTINLGSYDGTQKGGVAAYQICVNNLSQSDGTNSVIFPTPASSVNGQGKLLSIANYDSNSKTATLGWASGSGGVE